MNRDRRTEGCGQVTVGLSHDQRYLPIVVRAGPKRAVGGRGLRLPPPGSRHSVDWRPRLGAFLVLDPVLGAQHRLSPSGVIRQG